ncbi:basic secretory family protein [Allokutzneria sp. NRRL B-24872]|uniref:basic secretory family protein n=1 Tax=Allokutzneria sp. NRRL B-24872 TaxID=1137961 RepID=UPI001FED5631|nr:basic secretory family protein [Allokutzneria sp. NRRL B-24872]
MSWQGRYRNWLAAAVAAVLLAGLTVVSLPAADPVAPAEQTAPSLDPNARPAPPEPAVEPSVELGRSRISSVTDLLRRRADAVQSRDLSAFMSTLDPLADSKFLATQQAVFANLRGVPLREWRYRIDSTDSLGELDSLFGERPPDELWAPRVELSYAFDGVDRAATSRPMGYLFARRGSDWYLTSDTALADRGRKTWRGPWDFGHCRVDKTEFGIVLSHGGNQALANRVAGELDAAIRAVSEVWGQQWTQRVAVMLPETTAELQAMVGTEFAVDAIAAVAVADRVDHDSDIVEGARVVFNPRTATRLSASSLRVVLRHEITHIAARSDTVDGAPMWLLEGFADYVGYRDSGISPREAAPDLAKQLRLSGPPLALPSDADFRAGGSRLDLAYQTAWTTMLFLSQQYGEAKVVELYRRLAGVGRVPDGVVDGVLRDVLDTDRAEIIRGWGQFLRKTFG